MSGLTLLFNYKRKHIMNNKEQQRELLKDIIQADEKDGLYDDWDVTINDGIED
jgi:hypothetical protein